MINNADLFSSIPVGLCIIDCNGRIIEANPFFCNSAGLLNSSVSGKTFLELGLITFEESISLSHAIVSGKGEVLAFEISGGLNLAKLFSVSVSPYIFQHSECFLYTFNDVTRTRSAEQKLTKKLVSLENISNHLPVMIYNYCRTDQGDMYFDYISKGSEFILGYTPEELLNDFSILLDAIHPDDLQGMMDAIHSSAEKQHNWLYEYRLKHKDGTYRWVQGRSAPFKRERGALSWVGAVADISERKKIEKEKEQLEQRLYHSIEYTPNMAIQWYNSEGQVLYWNKASEALYGYLSSEVTGKTLDELIYNTEDAEKFLEIITNIKMTGMSAGPFETTIKNKDGKTKTVIASVYMIPGSDTDPVFVCMDSDISDHKKKPEDTHSITT